MLLKSSQKDLVVSPERRGSGARGGRGGKGGVKCAGGAGAGGANKQSQDHVPGIVVRVTPMSEL